ncbi:MAG: hypothetical protein PF689_01505 [Deltaproteobacteria bacterium]|jgi:hypothetical protein|nr:hypothetical protein [Deltaproteobacteria bacterium]
MKKLIALTTFILGITTFQINHVQAQSPCTGIGILGVGPFGIGIAMDCPPPEPPPAVVVIKRHRDRCRKPSCRPERRHPRRRHRRRRRRRRRPVYREPVVDNTPVVEAPSEIGNYSQMRRWSLAAIFDSSSFDDGGLAGGGIAAQFMFSPNWAIEGTYTTLTSCTNCNEYVQRIDSRVSTSMLYYLKPLRNRGIFFYAKAGLLFSAIYFEPETGATDMYDQTESVATELGGGLRWKLSDLLSLNFETTVMQTVGGEDIGHGTINPNQTLGVPDSAIDKTGINIRFGLAIHF